MNNDDDFFSTLLNVASHWNVQNIKTHWLEFPTPIRSACLPVQPWQSHVAAPCGKLKSMYNPRAELKPHSIFFEGIYQNTECDC